MLGGLLAVLGGERSPRETLLQMSEVSPYRGGLRFYADAQLAIGAQAIDPDAAFFVSDTLVLAVHGYVHFADRSPNEQSARAIAERFSQQREALWPQLRGEYSIILLDRQSRALWIWRDPMNGRFLHYSSDGATTLIATEIRQLRAVRSAPLTVARPVLAQLARSYSLAEPLTPFNEVQRFESGVCYRLTCNGAIVDHSRLPTVLDRIDPAAAKMAPVAVIEETKRLVDQALARTLGMGINTVLLSGGLDSRLVYASALAQLGSQRVTSLSHQFAGLDCDETRTIEAVHHSLQTTAHYCPYDTAEFEHSFAEMLARCDYPMFLTSHLTQQLLARIAPGVGDVVLGGFGGDEIFIANPRAVIDVPIAQRWAFRQDVAKWLGRSWRERAYRGWFEDMACALTPAALYQLVRRAVRGRGALSRDQARLRWFVLQRKHSTHGFYGMLEQLPASYGLDLRMPFRDLDLCAFLQSIHPLGLLSSGDTRGLQKQLLKRYLKMPISLTPQPKVNYTQVVELAVRSWPEMRDHSYRMESAMEAFVARFIASYSSQSQRNHHVFRKHHQHH